MKIDILETFNKMQNFTLPKNIYALRIRDEMGNLFDISVEHNGYCPNINSERDQSIFNDYLSNLEYSIVEEYFKSQKIKKPKSYSVLIEIMTNEKGELYHNSYSLN